MIRFIINKINGLYRNFKSIVLIFSLLIVIFFCYYTKLNFYERPLLSEKQKQHELSINCSKYGFHYSLTTKIPIYDFFLFGYELDMLEVHLYELYDHVTLFLIAESTRTLSGKTKPLYLKENWARYAKYHDKIRRVEVDLDIVQKSSDAWDNENKMRNIGLRLALPQISTYCINYWYIDF